MSDDKQYRDPATLFPKEFFIPGTTLRVSKSAPAMVEAAFEQGEPVFVIRAKDIFALPVLHEYLRQVTRYGPTNPAYLEDIDNIIEGFRQWQTGHVDQVRYPD